MNLIDDLRRSAEETRRNILEGFRYFLRISRVMLRMVVKGFNWGTNQLSGERTFKDFMKKHRSTMMTEDYLSKEDLKEVKEAAKKNKLDYAIIKVTPDKVKGLNRFGRIKELFNSKVEDASYKIVYDINDQVFMEEVLKQVAASRMERQLQMDPVNRTDFNKDGIVDAKDLSIDSTKTMLEVEDIEFGYEYGTASITDLEKVDRTVIECSRKDYVNHQMDILVEVQAYSALGNKGLDGEDTMIITVESKNGSNLKTIFDDNKLKYSMIEVSCNPEQPTMQYAACNHILLSDKNYKKFKLDYVDINYNAIYQKDEQDSITWKVIVDKKDVKKNYENNTKNTSLQERVNLLENEQEKTNEKNEPSKSAKEKNKNQDIDVEKAMGNINILKDEDDNRENESEFTTTYTTKQADGEEVIVEIDHFTVTENGQAEENKFDNVEQEVVIDVEFEEVEK